MIDHFFRMKAACIMTVFSSLLFGCAGIPKGIHAVNGFDVNRYLGKWYEIARLDHSFERGLTNVYAEYYLGKDGAVQVTNRGYDPKAHKWKEATGIAYFVEGPSVGRLKVSFFWPFYGGYNIIALDKKNYSYSLVCGPNRSYLWILSRTPEISENILKELVQFAKDSGFVTHNLIFVSQDMWQSSEKSYRPATTR